MKKFTFITLSCLFCFSCVQYTQVKTGVEPPPPDTTAATAPVLGNVGPEEEIDGWGLRDTVLLLAASISTFFHIR